MSADTNTANAGAASESASPSGLPDATMATSPNAGLGGRRACPHCEAKFYDLNKQPIVCPSCGKEFDPEILLKSRRVKLQAASKATETKSDDATANGDDNLPDELASDSDSDVADVASEVDKASQTSDGDD